jgi:hypothetical protein
MAGMRTIRLFVSSPGDVDDERKRVEFVAERLNGIFADIARFETFRWETKFYTAHKSFQPQIPEARDCDIVIGVLWARLGSELPPDFPRMPDNTPFLSGTAYEILSAIWRRQELEAGKDKEQTKGKTFSDVYVFQKRAPPFPPPKDEKDLSLVDTQWKLLKSFIDQWLRRPDGHFSSAYHTFGTTDEFEQQIESLLRDWLAQHVLDGRAVMWPIETKGSPFRGLEAFDASHTAVFFGRSHDVTRATDRLRFAAHPEIAGVPSANVALDTEPSVNRHGPVAAAIRQGSTFLLIVGASGAGKSSLARAGIVPRLTTPGVIKEVDIWRVAVMRPSDGVNPIAALAAALFTSAVQVGAMGGRSFTALPELADSDNRTPEELESHFRSASSTAIRPVERTLGRISATEKKHGGFSREVRADLLLVVDQLDDLFADDVAEADRTQFADLLAALVGTGRVWVVATLRAALYERFLKEGSFKALKDKGASYDLTPPGPAELVEIVRKPAEAADLVFERNNVGVSLDEQLLMDAAGADTLPLLQFTLQQLFEKREVVGNETRLTFDAYQALGGLAGAIDQAAEDALKNLSVSEQEALPRLLRQLAVPVHDAAAVAAQATVTVRAVPLQEAAPDLSSSPNLVRALVGARILTTSTEGKVSTVRITHQRVLESWKLAQEIVRTNADFFRIRSEIEDQQRRWQVRGRKSELLLPRGLPLAEAELIVDRYRDELSSEIREYVAISGRRARLQQRLIAVAALVFAGIAVVAVTSWRKAEMSLNAATMAISALIETTSDVVLPVAPLDTVEALVNQARESMDRLSSSSDDSRVSPLRARTMLLLAETDWERGNITRMREEAEQAFMLFDHLAQSGNIEYRHLRARSEHMVGLAYYDANDRFAARAHYLKGIAELSDLLKLNVGDGVSWRWRRSLADLNLELGDVLLHKFNEPQTALAAYEACYQDRIALTKMGHHGPAFDHDIAWAANKQGDVAVRMEKTDDALKWFGIARDGIEGLAENLWINLMWPDHLALIENNIGLIFREREGFEQASKAFGEAESLLVRVVSHDPNNLFRQNSLSWTYFVRGETEFRLALKTHDGKRLDQARDLLAHALQHYTDVANAAPNKLQWHIGQLGTRANLVAVDALIKQWAGDDLEAAIGFAAAADIFNAEFLPRIDEFPRPDFVVDTIEFDDWAGLAFIKAGKFAEGHARLIQAHDIVQRYRAVIGVKDATVLEKRMQEHLDIAKAQVGGSN